MTSLLELLRASLASLARAPGFSLTVILTLGLGLGAATGIYSVFHHLLLEPLPVQQPERLANLAAPGPRQGSTSCGIAGPCEMVFSHPLFRDLERGQSIFDGLAAHVELGANVAFNDRTSAVDALLVSGEYFSTLGLSPTHGRLIGTADDSEVGQNPVAVLSYNYWQRELGGDPGAVGTTIRVNGENLSIIGIAPPGFGGTTRGREAELFVPLSLRWLLQPGMSSDPEDRKHHFLYLFARLKPGMELEQARAGINPLYRAMLVETEAPLQTRLTDAERVLFLEREILLQPGDRGQSEVTSISRVPMTIVLGATLMLLLIACANVANLMLARVTKRSGEIAVRSALGAGRGQGGGLLLVESLLLAVAGGLVGLVLAAGFIELIERLLQTSLVSGIQPGLHAGVVGFAALLSLACAGLCGGYPAWRASRIPPAAALSAASSRSGSGPRPARVRNALVTGQIGLSLTLLITASLFAHSLWNVSQVEPGMETESVLTFAVSPVRSGYSAKNAITLFEELEQRLAALPGVEAASAAIIPVLTGFGWQANAHIADPVGTGEIERNVHYNMVGEDFFATLGIALRAGRSFDARDRAGSPWVAVVNEAFVRDFELSDGALGIYFDHDGRRDRVPDVEIIGVVADTRPQSVKGNLEPQFYLPWPQVGQPGRMHFYLRTNLNPGQLRPAVRAAVAELDPQLPIEDFDTLENVVRATVVLDRSVGTLAGLVAAMALVLVTVGLHGVLSYTLAQRTREIGLRTALGADSGRVQRMIAGQVLSMAALGGVLGLAAAWALSRAMGALLFGLTGLDIPSALVAVVVVAVIVFAGAWLPTRRAASIQPMEALRRD